MLQPKSCGCLSFSTANRGNHRGKRGKVSLLSSLYAPLLFCSKHDFHSMFLIGKLDGTVKFSVQIVVFNCAQMKTNPPAPLCAADYGKYLFTYEFLKFAFENLKRSKTSPF